MIRHAHMFNPNYGFVLYRFPLCCPGTAVVAVLPTVYVDGTLELGEEPPRNRPDE